MGKSRKVGECTADVGGVGRDAKSLTGTARTIWEGAVGWDVFCPEKSVDQQSTFSPFICSLPLLNVCGIPSNFVSAYLNACVYGHIKIPLEYLRILQLFRFPQNKKLMFPFYFLLPTSF